MQKESTIQIVVALDEQKVPQQISWSATDSTADMRQQAKAMQVSFWDGEDKAALRIDLWTKDMMVDEMGDFYYQCLLGMADTLGRSTGETALVADMKAFAQTFFQKFQESQRQKNKG
ncbi:MAG: gliding motility protein GldC [Bacteroidetes bacterium]|nr:MAG: gliding motility protein GldC [Bacteroidota bacterium]